MKDHELRELINDVTAVARTYAHTQQLREQISHLIAPIFKKLESKHEAQVMRQREEMVACLKDKENLNRQLDFEAKQRTELRKELATAQTAANNSSVENIVLKKRLFQAEGRNGPDFTDGHDCEGFAGGYERMGCPGGSECTELPANKK